MNILICVKGKDCNLPDIALDQMTKSVVLEKKASAMFRAIRDPKENVDRDLHVNNHADMIVNFSPRSAAGADALAEANNYQISEDLLNKDIDKLKELGSLQA